MRSGTPHSTGALGRAARVGAFLLGVCAPSFVAAGGPAVSGDPAALAVYREMHAALRTARTLSYESDYVRETGGREIGRSFYRIWLKKPNEARIESRSGDGEKTGVLVLDGREMWIYWPNGRPYLYGSDSTANARDGARSYIRKDASKGTHSIARETSLLGTGMSMTIIDPSVFLTSPDLMDALLEKVTSAGSGNADGEVCDIIEADYAHGERTRVFWVSRRDHLPRRLEETVRVTRDIVVREEWREVSVDAKIPDDLFRWRPPARWAEYRLPRLEDALLEAGSAAPDFDVSLLDGGRFRLSDHRGSVVWLSFWRISCVPCRSELETLQKLDERYAARGLIVLPFNSSDDGASIRRFFAARRISLSSVSDTTAAAREVFAKRYQVASAQSAMPLNYIIDREGRVADAWYGYRKGDGRGEKVLWKLGIIE
jgi:outer membrane lipoprotein-sorting protein/peroxiredoxin